MARYVLIAADFVAINALVLGVFVPRFRRRDMMVALYALNLGVLSIAMLLASTEVNAGLGLGLFGLLSIVRLRSDEMTHEEMAFYFTALILGLIGGITTEPLWLPIALMGALVGVVFVAGHPRFLRDMQVMVITLDAALVGEKEIRERLESLVDGPISRVRVRSVDLVNDSAVVEIRYSKMEGTAKSGSAVVDATELKLAVSAHDGPGT